MFAIFVLVVVAIVFVVMIGAMVAGMIPWGWLGVPIALFLVTFVAWTGTTVEPREIGVVKTFGKLSEETLQPGFHTKWPWQNVIHLDGKVQTDEYRGDDCITVQLADKNTACISATNRWRVAASGADQVVAEYSGSPTEDLRDAVVSTEFKAAVFNAFGDVDQMQEGALDTSSLETEIKTAAQSAAGDLVEIRRVTISYIRLGEKAQAKVDAIGAQKAQTAIAEEKKETAELEADANKILSDSISNDPNVLVSKCFDLINEGFRPSAGFQCWPGGAGGVVIPSGGN